MVGRRRTQRAEELGIARDDARAALERLDDDRSQLVGVLGNEPRRSVGIVVLADDPAERRVEWRDTVREEQDSAVIRTLEDEDARPATGCASKQEREQVRLRSRVAETDEVDRREPRDDRFGERCLEPIRRAEDDPVRQGLANRLDDDRMRVTVEAGRVLAEEVDVLVTVRVGDAGAIAPNDRQRERRLVDGRARVAARHDAGALLVQPERLGIRGGVPGLRLTQPCGEIRRREHESILRLHQPGSPREQGEDAHDRRADQADEEQDPACVLDVVHVTSDEERSRRHRRPELRGNDDDALPVRRCFNASEARSSELLEGRGRRSDGEVEPRSNRNVPRPRARHRRAR